MVAPQDEATPAPPAQRPPTVPGAGKGLIATTAVLVVCVLVTWDVVRGGVLGGRDPEVVTVASGDALEAALRDAEQGDVVVLEDGVHPSVELQDLALPGVTLRGETRNGVVVEGLSLQQVSGLTVSSMTVVNARDSDRSAVDVRDGSHDVTLRALTITPQRFSAVDIQATTRDVALRQSTLIGDEVTGDRATDNTSRGVRINGAPYDDPDDWPSDVLIADNEIRGFGSDLIQIGGGRRITIRGNDLRDPQSNADHNDGVQSYGSDRLVIEGNRFSAEGANGPNQAIILQHHPSLAELRVTRTTISGNLITSWPGTGIMVAGAEDTTITGNTVGPTGVRTRPGSGIAVHGENSDLEIERNVAQRVYVTEDEEPDAGDADGSDADGSDGDR